jgi:hypothetical protein
MRIKLFFALSSEIILTMAIQVSVEREDSRVDSPPAGRELELDSWASDWATNCTILGYRNGIFLRVAPLLMGPDEIIARNLQCDLTCDHGKSFRWCGAGEVWDGEHEDTGA